MLRQSLNYVAVGLEMGISVAIGIAAGSWLDSKYGTHQIFFWIGFVVGLGAAVKAVTDAIRKIRKELK
ncbi:MAG: AtpZ/AtpI family protein [Deltaproteobacteria bacterium]|nr:AtpZ/AtpI family protein [Deltaproteobacteria bacterium]